MARFLTIGEFSRRTGVSVSALRFYDRVGVLVPADVDPTSSYRRYGPDQVGDGQLVRDLRRLEMPLAQITAYLAGDGDERRRLLDTHLVATAERLQDMRTVADSLRARLDPDPEEPDPMSNADSATVSVSVDAAALGAAIDQVTPAASTNPEFPLLQTVLVEARDGTLRVVATDRYRLAVRDLVTGPAGTASGEGFRALVAAAALVRIRSQLRERPAGTTVNVERSEHALVIGDDPAAGKMLAMAAEFPEYEKLLAAADGARPAVVSRTELQDLLETVADADVMRLSFEDGRLVLDGDRSRSVAATFDAADAPPTVGLRPSFVRDAVDAAVGPEVLIDIVEAHRPVVFRSATDGSYICMVMPIKLA